VSDVWKFVYVSAVQGAAPDIVEEVLETSIAKNAASQISGVLFHDGKSFLQVLEGARGSIADCVLRISADHRHTNMRVICSGPTLVRFFSNWGMGRAVLPAHRRSLSGYAEELMALAPASRMVAVDEFCLQGIPVSDES
jgi:hypothetical protein